MASTDSGDTSIIQPYRNDTPSKVKLTIHNQFPDIELVFPMYSGDDVVCYLPPDQKVDAGSTTRVGFNINFSWRDPAGVLMYKLNRKNVKQFNKGAISNEDEAGCVRLLVAWKINYFNEFHVLSFLMEHDKGRIWDIDMLVGSADDCGPYDMQHGPIEKTWLMRDNTALLTRMNVTLKECYKLDLTISKTSIKDDTWRPPYFDMNG
jgi:hypothetical protein